MLSIFSTFTEALLLGVRNFWFLVALTLVTQTPGILFEVFGETPKHSLSPVVIVLMLAELLIPLALSAANIAAILGLLKNRATDVGVWTSAWRNMQMYGTTLLRLSLLLIGVAFLVLIPFGILIKLVGPAQVITVLRSACFLIFAKYALAGPLVVNENMGARAALKRSWEMTRGHFAYVGGCYLFLGGLMVSPLEGQTISASGITYILIKYLLELGQSLWTILAWCMYLRIKEAEVPA
jgi:hypothetical protein